MFKSMNLQIAQDSPALNGGLVDPAFQLFSSQTHLKQSWERERENGH